MEQILSKDDLEAVELLKAMLRINTVNPPGNEAELAKWLASWLAQRDIEAEVVEVGENRANLVVRLAGNQGPALFFTGHLDTVPPGNIAWDHDPFSAEQVGQKIFGRGAADMKSGLAAMLVALVQLKRDNVVLPRDIILLATAGEEIECLGANAYVQTTGMENIGAVVVGEPTNGDVIVAHKGAAWVEISTQGQTAHGSMPHLGINAIVKMNKFITALMQQKFAVLPDKWLNMPTFSINRITGGVATNVVPDSCTCQIDFRLIPGQSLDDVLNLIETAAAAVRVEEQDYKVDIKVLSYRQPVACPEGHAVIATAVACARQSTADVGVRGINYYTDASVLLEGHQLPVIFYGPGDDAQAHQPNEYVMIKKYLTAINFYKSFARQWA